MPTLISFSSYIFPPTTGSIPLPTDYKFFFIYIPFTNGSFMLPTDYSVFFIYIPPKKAFLPRSVVYGRGRNAFLPAIRLVQETIPPLIMPNANEESFKRIPRHCTHDKIFVRSEISGLPNRAQCRQGTVP